MKRSTMLRYIEGLLSTVDGEKLTYKQKANHILSSIEAVGMRPPAVLTSNFTYIIEDDMFEVINMGWEKEYTNKNT